MVSDGKLDLCFAVRHYNTNLVSLEMMLLHDFTLASLFDTPACVAAARAAVEALGFRRVYGKGVAVDGHDDHMITAADLSPLSSGQVLEAVAEQALQAVAGKVSDVF